MHPIDYLACKTWRISKKHDIPLARPRMRRKKKKGKKEKKLQRVARNPTGTFMSWLAEGPL
jgi:hypothetical protein